MRAALKVLAAACLAAFVAVGPLGAAENPPADCGNDTVTLDGSGSLWPPNHTDHAYTVTYHGDTEPPEDEGKILATEGTHDEQVTDAEGNVTGEENGSGKPNNGADINPAADTDTVENGEAQTSHTLRAERSGRGDGRVYTIHWQVFAPNTPEDQQSDDTALCMGDFTVDVPHDQRAHNGK